MQVQFHSIRSVLQVPYAPIPLFVQQLKALGFTRWTLFVDERYPGGRTILVTSSRNLVLPEGKPGEVLFFVGINKGDSVAQRRIDIITAVLVTLSGKEFSPSMSFAHAKKFPADSTALPTRENMVQTVMEEYRTLQERRREIRQTFQSAGRQGSRHKAQKKP